MYWINLLRNRKVLNFFLFGVAFALIFSPAGILANEAATGGGAAHAATNFPLIFLWIAVILMLAKVSSLIERVGQPAVLGELLIGVVLGSLYLFGINFFEDIKTNEIIHFLAELGVVILLFQIGIESSVQTMSPAWV